MATLNDTQVKLIHSAFDVVSRVGLEGFSVRQVTSGVGVSSRLVYKYFDTKENFLFECFLYVDREIAAGFDDLMSRVSFEDPAAVDAVRQIWIPYFKFMVGLGNQALFYYAYRDSSHIDAVIKHDAVSAESYFKGFTSYVNELNIPETPLGSMSEDVLWTYIIDCTGMFAKRMIRGEIPNNDETIEQIWRLISRGLAQ